MRRHHYKPYLGEHGTVIRPAPTTNGITARYENFSHSGTTWFDVTPTPANGTDGTIGAAFTWPAFNGESFVNFGDPTKLEFATDFSVVAWYRQSTDPPTQGYERIVSRDTIAAVGGVTTRCFSLQQRDDTGIAQGFIHNNVGNVNPVASGTYNTGTYHMAVLVNDASNTNAYYYVDGIVRSTKIGQGGPVTTWGAINTEAGRHQLTGNVTDYFTGDIDTVRFYNRALSPDEILNDYNAGKPAHP
jgi:hypothetical protein